MPVLQTNQTPLQQQTTTIQMEDLVTVLLTTISARWATQRTLPRKISMLSGKEHSTLLVRTESCITSVVSRVLKCAYMSSSSYMYSNLNFRTLATVLMSYVIYRRDWLIGACAYLLQQENLRLLYMYALTVVSRLYSPPFCTLHPAQSGEGAYFRGCN